MKALSVAALMKTQVIAARRGWPLHQAETVTLDAGIRHLPVVEDADRLIGIVSQRDLGRAAALERATAAAATR